MLAVLLAAAHKSIWLFVSRFLVVGAKTKGCVRMAMVISIVNIKGGTGKTTTTSNLGEALVQQKKVMPTREVTAKSCSGEIAKQL